MKKLFILSFFIFQLFITPAPPALAVICNPLIGCTPSTNPKGYFNTVLTGVISIMMIVGVLYFVWHIVFAGYHLIGGQGDPKNFEQAKNELTYSLIGLIVIFAVFAIIKFIGTVLGIPGLNTLKIIWPTL